MSHRILLGGGPSTLRRRLAAEIDAGFDVVLEQADDALAAVAQLPASDWDLFVVLSGGGRVPGLDLVRLLDAHALHGKVPVLFVGGSPSEQRAAIAAGAERTLTEEPEARELADAVAELLGVA